MRWRYLGNLGVLAILLWLPSPGAGESAIASVAAQNAAVNGCGSGWNTWLVPDSIPVLQCNLVEACNQHDRCYGKCEGRARDATAAECEYLACREGGNLYQSERCETDIRLVRLLSDAQQRRRSCDQTLADDIASQNAGKVACEAFAAVYRFAVQKWGDSAFRGIDAVLLADAVGQPKAEYDAAIREFFRSGTTEQFERFMSRTSNGGRSVDLAKPIEFDPETGLVNKVSAR